MMLWYCIIITMCLDGAIRAGLDLPWKEETSDENEQNDGEKQN